MSTDQLESDYKVLIKAINPVFSGSVNTLINKLDYKKIKRDEKLKETEIK